MHVLKIQIGQNFFVNKFLKDFLVGLLIFFLLILDQWLISAAVDMQYEIIIATCAVETFFVWARKVIQNPIVINVPDECSDWYSIIVRKII